FDMTMGALTPWVRRVFQRSLEVDARDAAEAILRLAVTLASDTQSGHVESESHYPDEEVEWLATKAFNRAIDFYLAGQDDMCARWSLAAMELAGAMHDGGALLGVLEEKACTLQL
ncbi:hypothetical protein KEM52_002246, partial [Ascosphaera acerosa]